MRTLKGDDYVFNIAHSEDFYVLLTSSVQGLRTRSRFAVLTQETTQLGEQVVVSYGACMGSLLNSC